MSQNRLPDSVYVCPPHLEVRQGLTLISSHRWHPLLWISSFHLDVPFPLSRTPVPRRQDHSHKAWQWSFRLMMCCRSPSWPAWLPNGTQQVGGMLSGLNAFARGRAYGAGRQCPSIGTKHWKKFNFLNLGPCIDQSHQSNLALCTCDLYESKFCKDELHTSTWKLGGPPLDTDGSYSRPSPGSWVQTTEPRASVPSELLP
jgi:hypothetical protein